MNNFDQGEWKSFPANYLSKIFFIKSFEMEVEGTFQEFCNFHILPSAFHFFAIMAKTVKTEMSNDESLK